MFLRATKRFKDGKVHYYWSMVENVRVGRRVFQRRALYLGELNDSQSSEWQWAVEAFGDDGKPHQLKLFPGGAARAEPQGDGLAGDPEGDRHAPTHRSGDTFVLTRSEARSLKETSMRAKKIRGAMKTLFAIDARFGRPKWRKAEPSKRKLTRDELISRLAVAEAKAGRAWKMISLTLPKADEEVTPETFRWSLDRERIREARAKDEGTYLLRTNLEDCDPKTLWKKYMIQGEIEYAFRELKGDLGLRSVYHQMEVAPRKDYLFRTEWNVTHSDATLIIARKVARVGAFHEELTGGTLRTERFAAVHAKPRLAIFEQNVEAVLAWLSRVAAQLQREEIVLNVAGPRESKCPGIEQSTCAFIKRLLARVQEMSSMK